MDQSRFSQTAGTIGAEHANPVCIVDHQDHMFLFTQSAKFAQWCDIAVHAEYAIGREQGRGIGTACQLTLRCGDVAMCIAFEFGAGQISAVEQAGMIELVLHAKIAVGQQRLHRAEIGHVAGREQQRAIAPGPLRQFLFQRRMFVAMPTEQMCCTGADSPTHGGKGQGFAHSSMLGEAKVVVAGEIKQRFAIDDDARAVDGSDRTQAAQQVIACTLRMCLGQTREQVRARHCGKRVVAQAAASASRSACTVPGSTSTSIGLIPSRANKA